MCVLLFKWPIIAISSSLVSNSVNVTYSKQCAAVRTKSSETMVAPQWCLYRLPPTWTWKQSHKTFRSIWRRHVFDFRRSSKIAPVTILWTFRSIWRRHFFYLRRSSIIAPVTIRPNGESYKFKLMNALRSFLRLYVHTMSLTRKLA